MKHAEASTRDHEPAKHGHDKSSKGHKPSAALTCSRAPLLVIVGQSSLRKHAPDKRQHGKPEAQAKDRPHQEDAHCIRSRVEVAPRLIDGLWPPNSKIKKRNDGKYL